MINDAFLAESGFKFVEESSHPFNSYWKKGRIAVDLKTQRLFLIRNKPNENYAELYLPKDIQTFEETVQILKTNKP